MRDRNQVPAGKLFVVEKLDVFRAALDLLGMCDRLSPRLWRKNSALWRQLQRASASVIANIGEAASCLSRGDRRRYYEYAYRSSGECVALVLSFSSLGTLTSDETETARELLHRTQMMLLRLIQRAATPQPRAPRVVKRGRDRREPDPPRDPKPP